MHAVRQAIAAEIESQALQEECSNFQSLSPRREFSSFYSSNHEEFLSTPQLRSNSYCVPCATKHVDVDFSSTSDDTYHPPLQDISSDSSDKENELIKVESTIPSIKSWEMLDPSLQSVLPNEEDITYVVTEYRPLSP